MALILCSLNVINIVFERSQNLLGLDGLKSLNVLDSTVLFQHVTDVVEFLGWLKVFEH